MEAVQPVVVDVEIAPIEGGSTVPSGIDDQAALEASTETEKTEGNWSRADPATAAAISSLISKGWGLSEDQIIVRQPADQQKAK